LKKQLRSSIPKQHNIERKKTIKKRTLSCWRVKLEKQFQLKGTKKGEMRKPELTC
jgi:hypothetical protein